MINPSNLTYKKKIIIAESAIFNGLEKTVSYYGIRESLVLKYVKNLDILQEKNKNFCLENSKNGKIWYEKQSLEYKKKKSQYKRESFVKYSKKHCLRTLLKNLKKNLKAKGYDHIVTVTIFDLWCLAKRQKLKCAISGIKLTKDNLSIDHIIPLSKGGTSDLFNLQIVDKDVNIMKGTLLINDFLEKIKIIMEFNKKF